MAAAIHGRVDAVRLLLERMAEFCPNVLGEGCDTPANLARAMNKERRFLLRWD